jgi:hypothetical protein
MFLQNPQQQPQTSHSVERFACCQVLTFGVVSDLTVVTRSMGETVSSRVVGGEGLCPL